MFACSVYVGMFFFLPVNCSITRDFFNAVSIPVAKTFFATNQALLFFFYQKCPQTVHNIYTIKLVTFQIIAFTFIFRKHRSQKNHFGTLYIKAHIKGKPRLFCKVVGPFLLLLFTGRTRW